MYKKLQNAVISCALRLEFLEMCESTIGSSSLYERSLLISNQDVQRYVKGGHLDSHIRRLIAEVSEETNRLKKQLMIKIEHCKLFKDYEITLQNNYLFSKMSRTPQLSRALESELANELQRLVNKRYDLSDSSSFKVEIDLAIKEIVAKNKKRLELNQYEEQMPIYQS